MNRYNELSAEAAQAIDLLINALASSPGADIDPVRTTTEAVRAVRTYTVTLDDYEVDWLSGQPLSVRARHRGRSERRMG